MIITILPGSGIFHAVAYNENKVKTGQAVLMEAQNIYGIRQEAYTGEKLRQYFIDYSTQKNSRTKNAQFHFSVSCKGREFSHQKLLDIAHMYLKEMGYADDGQPLLVYAHHDTPNNHIHVITSRINPQGMRISDKFEKKRSRKVTQKIMQEYTGQRQEPSINEVAAQALAYRFTTKTQYCAILQSQGYECKDDSDKPIVHLYKGGEELGTINVQLIMQHTLKNNNPEQKRRRQLKAILQKYRNLSANKEELAAAMKKKFGISLVYLGQKDSPFGYILVDHKNKAVFKGGDFLSIKELLQFEDAPTRFAKIEKTIDELLLDNPKLTTADVNKILYRQFGTRIHKGTVSWNGQTIQLKNTVVEQLRKNYQESKGIKEKPISVQTPQQVQGHKRSGKSNVNNPLANAGGSSDSNREYEVGGMDLSVDNEETQRAKWRR